MGAGGRVGIDEVKLTGPMSVCDGVVLLVHDCRIDAPGNANN